MLTGSRLITPEAVVLDLPTAGLGTRIVCRVIDIVASVAAAGALSVAVLALSTPTVATVFAIVAGFGVLVLYPALCEGLWSGRTVGKLVFGLRVVRTDGGPISMADGLVRAALGLIEVFGLACIGAVAIFATHRSQRLGDLAAGTLVVRERRGRTGSLGPVRLRMPPGLEGLVHEMDVVAMTERDYEVVRQFLLRWREWRNDAARQQVAARLAGPLWRRMRHPVPPGLAPDYYLACLGAAYQLRHPAEPGQLDGKWSVRP